MRKSPLLRVALIAAYSLAAHSAWATEITVLGPGPVQGLLQDAAASFGKQAGVEVKVETASSLEIGRKIKAGEPFDVVVSSPGMLKELIDTGFVSQGKAVATGYAIMVVQKGNEKPDASTPDAIRRLIQRAKTISFSDPALGGGSS